MSVWTMLTVLSEGAMGDTQLEMTNTLRHPRDNRRILRDAYKVIEKAFIVNTSTVELAAVNSFLVDRSIMVILFPSILFNKCSYLPDIMNVL